MRAPHSPRPGPVRPSPQRGLAGVHVTDEDHVHVVPRILGIQLVQDLLHAGHALAVRLLWLRGLL